MKTKTKRRSQLRTEAQYETALRALDVLIGGRHTGANVDEIRGKLQQIKRYEKVHFGKYIK